MRALPYLTVLMLTVLLFSCSKRQDTSKESVPPAGETEEDIVAAVRFAYSLEEELWEREGKIDEKEDVVTFFRKGFSEKLARDYADYIWMDERGKNGTRYRMLRASEPVLIPPEKMTVVGIEEDRATVLLEYEESTEGPLTWEAHTDRVTLRLEPDGWKIYDISTR
jgi:hypothetical protein